CAACPSDKPYWDGTQCVATCPASKPTYDSNKVCVTCASLDSAKPAWSTTNQKCDTCYAVNNAKPNWNGSACAACPSDKPYWDGTQCVATCPASKPTDDSNKVCVTCASLDSAKPAWSTTNKKCDTCYAVNNAKPYWNGSACAVCPTGKPYWDGATCVATCPANTYPGNNSVCVNVTTWCTQKMQNAGYSTSRFTVSGITITYKSDMTVSTALDISKCDLTVQGELTVNSGKSLKALAVLATSSSTGINNSGTINATNISSSSSDWSGIINSGNISVSGMITAEGNGWPGINNLPNGYMSANKIVADGSPAISTYSYSVMIAAESIFASAYSSQIINHSGEMHSPYIYICSTTGTPHINVYGLIIGKVEKCNGVVYECTGLNSVLHIDYCFSCEKSFVVRPYWDATNKVCRACVDINEKMPYYNSTTNKCTACPTDKPYWSGMACETQCPLEKPKYNSNKICYKCPIEKPYWDGLNCVEVCSNGNPAYGYICATNINSCSYKMSQAGFTDFTVNGNTITYSGDMSVSKNLDISNCDLILKTTYGGLTVQNATLRVKNLIVDTLLGRGIYIYSNGVIKATGNINVTGAGIHNDGNIEASNIYSTAYTVRAIDNGSRGTISVENTISGISSKMYGIDNSGTIKATTVIGKSESDHGIRNNSNGTTTATNIYYCKTIQNNGTSTGTQKYSCN
ncbi:MAG: hypothetical protein IKJ28_06745, partial [Alphaproteobacteria bacterium]|nr:hypothetical protein [Alphaproteobacteria bacterium]